VPSDGSSPIDQKVQVLLRQHVESYEQLETLVLLASAREQVWVPRAVAGRLGISEDAALDALEHLHRAGFAKLDPAGKLGFTYDVDDADENAAVVLLADAYENRRLEVMKLMSTNAVERVRTAAIRTFADAFVLGKKKDG
jgi:hypothetical protein